MVPADHVCQAGTCGKGVSVVKKWVHSQRKETKYLWFCFKCYDKEVRIPRLPQLFLDVPPRTVSTLLASFDFAEAGNRAEKGRKCAKCPSVKTCCWRIYEKGGWWCNKCYCEVANASKKEKKE